jgi:hypothetical protein
MPDSGTGSEGCGSDRKRIRIQFGKHVVLQETNGIRDNEGGIKEEVVGQMVGEHGAEEGAILGDMTRESNVICCIYLSSAVYPFYLCETVYLLVSFLRSSRQTPRLFTHTHHGECHSPGMHLCILLGDRYCPCSRSPRYRPSSPRSTGRRRCTRTEEHVLDQSLRDSWDYKEPDPTWDVGGQR